MAKAIVCDKCGKVVLLPDSLYVGYPDDFCHLSGRQIDLDLCNDCADALVEATREVGYADSKRQ